MTFNTLGINNSKNTWQHWLIRPIWHVIWKKYFPCKPANPVLTLPVAGTWLKSPYRDRTLLLCNYPSHLFRSHCMLSPEHKRRYFKPCSRLCAVAAAEAWEGSFSLETPQKVELFCSKICFLCWRGSKSQRQIYHSSIQYSVTISNYAWLYDGWELSN